MTRWHFLAALMVLFGIPCVADSPKEVLVFIPGNTGAIYTATSMAAVLTTEKLMEDNGSSRKFAVSADGKCIFIPRKGLLGTGSEWQTKELLKLRSLNPSGVRIAAVASPIALSPDGEMAAYVSATQEGMAICSSRLSTDETTTIAGQLAGVSGLTWSPDGSKLAYFCESGPYRQGTSGGLRLHILEPASGQDSEIDGPLLPIRYGGDWREGVVWSPDGTRVYYERKDETDSAASYGVYEAVVSTPSTHKRIADGLCSSISADGRTLYLTDRGDIYALDISPTENKKSLLVERGHHARISPSGELLAYLRPGRGLWCRDLLTGQDTQLSDQPWGNDADSFAAFRWTTPTHLEK